MITLIMAMNVNSLLGNWRFRRIWLNLKLTGWWPVAVSTLVLGAFFILESSLQHGRGTENLIYARRAIETIVPLLFAIQTAILIGPDNEEGIELLLSYPVPLGRIFLERLGLFGCMHGLLAIIATLVFSLTWHIENPLLATVRWLASGIFLSGLAAITTQLTRQSIFSLLLVTLVWASALFGGESLLRVWPWSWSFQVYLPPETTTLTIYLLNRLILIAMGLLLFLAALKFLGDEERVLGTR